MKHVIALAGAAFALAGCHQSIDRQFKDLCAEQEAHDPDAWASTEGACRNAKNLPDSDKKAVIDAYADLKRARKAVGQ